MPQHDKAPALNGAVDEDEDDRVLENAAFGITRVNLKAETRPARTSTSTWFGLKRHKSTAIVPSATSNQPRQASGGRSKTASQSQWTKRLERWIDYALFLDTVLSLMVAPLRIGFLFDPLYQYNEWSSSLTVLVILDGVSLVINLIPATAKRLSAAISSSSVSRRHSTDRAAVSDMTTFRMMSTLPSKIEPEEMGIAGPPSALLDEPNSPSRNRRPTSARTLKESSKDRWRAYGFCLVKLFLQFPWELCCVVAGAYNLSHIASLPRYMRSVRVLAKLFGKAVKKHFRTSALVSSLAFSTGALVFHLTWMGLYLCHISAAGYMLIAHWECGLDSSRCEKTPVPGNWVLKDELERGSLWRQYVRTMYWASKTVTTLGQGDLVPATELETNYCIIVQYISGLWATAFLSACGFAFSRRDANMQESIATRYEQSLQFVEARNLKTQAKLDVMSYFQYMLRTRDGIDEASVLSGLPTRYQSHCSHQLKKSFVKRVPIFRQHDGAFLRAILDALTEDFFPSNCVVVECGDVEELLIVSSGEVRVSNAENVVVRRLLQGNFYADYALQSSSISANRLITETASEVWWLPRRTFEDVVKSYFPTGKREKILGRGNSQTKSDSVDGPAMAMAGPSSKDLALRKLMDKVDRDTEKSSKAVALWRFPSSAFRYWWRNAECMWLLYIALEVPIQVAFSREFSVHNVIRGGTATTVLDWARVANYVAGLLGELFFITNWWLKAYVFVRRIDGVLGTQQTDNQSGSRGMIVESKQIFRHYVENEDIVSDIISLVPISVVWDVVSKQKIAATPVMYVGYARLLRLVRLRDLKTAMRSVLTERNLGPPTQLLVFNSIGCLILANFAACIYYLAAGRTGEDRLPVTTTRCLSDATLHGNCSWVQRDVGEYGIDVPYVRSMHWSLVLLSTVGYGDVLSFSDLECFIGFWWIYLGAMICYFTASAVSSVISHWGVLQSAKNTKLEEINRTLMSFKAVSTPTVTTVRRYYRTNWKMNGSAATEREILEHIPSSLRLSISQNLYGCITKCQLFSPIQDAPILLRELASRMSLEVFLAGMIVIGHGHTAVQVFVIESGAVDVFVDAPTTSAKPTKITRRLSDQRTPPAPSGLVHSRLSNSVSTTALSVAVLRKSDVFGEESLSYPEMSTYMRSARTLTVTQVIVLHREAVLGLRDRFEREIGELASMVGCKRVEDQHLLVAVKQNITHRKKILKMFGHVGILQTRLDEGQTIEQLIINPLGIFAKVWASLVSLALFYNFYAIVFRMAFLPEPSTTTMKLLHLVDYTIDGVLFLDMYLKWNHLGYTDYAGGVVLDRSRIRQRYQRGWLKWDLFSMIPIYYPNDAFAMALARLPRLTKSPQLLLSLRGLEEIIQEHVIRGGSVLLNVFDMFKFLVFFLSAAHYLGSYYYLLGRLQLKYKIVSYSWVNQDQVLAAYPDRVEVHYIRSIYWCLETFTVVCFGDVLARNVAETLYASATCIMGWIFIGQVIGRMTTLVLKLDKEAHAHAERVKDFEEYAKRRLLPQHVRERAKESAEYKSKTLLELNASRVLEELPSQLKHLVFEEAYGPLVRENPELNVLTRAQVQALSAALSLEIFMRDDVIFKEGRITTRLYIMKEGRGELFSSSSSIVYSAIHEGVMFGDVAFFLPGVKNYASARAHTSCQVLQLERRKWRVLWPDHVRRDIEERLTPTMREKYGVITKIHLNIVKNFEMSKNTVSRQVVPLRRRRTLRALMLADKGKLERHLLASYDIIGRAKRPSSLRMAVTKIRGYVTSLFNSDDGSIANLLSSSQTAHNRSRANSGVNKVRAQRPDRETMWNRHSRKLRVIRMLQAKKVQAETELHALGGQGSNDEPTSRVGVLTRRKSTGDQAPPPSHAQQSDYSTFTVMSEKRSGMSTRSSRGEEQLTRGSRRHSIQVTTDDMFKKFEKVQYSDALDEAAPDPMQSRNRRNSHAQDKSRPPLAKGGTWGSVTADGKQPGRARSNSIHEMLKIGAAAEGVRRVSLYARALSGAITSAFKSQQSQGDLYGIWSEPPLPPSFVLEDSTFRRMWRSVMLVICLYYAIIVPFRASFMYEFAANPDRDDGLVAWFVVEYLMDAVCWIDFYLCKNHFSFVHRGELVTDARAIRDHYLHDGTYVLDLASLVPLELLALCIDHATWYHVSVLRLNKLVRIIHLHQLSERVQHMLVYDFKVTRISPSVLYMVRFMFDFALGAHWVACLAYSVAFHTYIEDGRASWLTTAGMLTFSGCDGLACVSATHISSRFSRSYHFSLGAITTVSYGDIAPQNAAETTVTAVIIILSITLFGMLSGGFFQMIEMEIGRRADYEQRVAQVAQYMQFHRFHPRMWKQMQVYFAVHWAESKGMNEDELLRGLTTSVRQDIAFMVMHDFVKNLRLFANAEPEFARAVITAFQQELFVRNDTIISEGDTERSLYVIESGLVSVRIFKKSTQEQLEVIKGRYEFIGEKSLIFGVPRTATCVALCACSVLILTLDKYERILEEFPEYREKNVREWMFSRGGARPSSQKLHKS